MVPRPIAIALAATFTARLVAAQDAPEPAPRGPEIVATGQAMRTVQADRATVHVAVRTNAATPSSAGSLNATFNNAIRAAVAGLGVPRDDISTAGYLVTSTRAPDPRGFVYSRDSGFVATNTVRIVLRRPEHLALIGRVIDTSLAAGATHISGVYYEARRTDDAEREALADAVAEARARAEVMARAAGGSLGDLIQVSAAPSTSFRPMPAYSSVMLRGVGPEQPTTITPSEIEVRQSVTARWRFVARR